MNGQANGGVHAVPLRVLAQVFGALLILTVLTVVLANYHFGPFDLWIAMGIATLKALLVALFFMHLRWDRPFNGVIFLCSLVFVFIFIGFCLLDTSSYQDQVKLRQNDLLMQKK